MTFDEALKKYSEHFGVNGIPLFAFPTLTEDEWVARMVEAIKSNRPIVPTYDDDCDY